MFSDARQRGGRGKVFRFVKIFSDFFLNHLTLYLKMPEKASVLSGRKEGHEVILPKLAFYI